MTLVSRIAFMTDVISSVMNKLAVSIQSHISGKRVRIFFLQGGFSAQARALTSVVVTVFVLITIMNQH